jgi:hypothetical protein
MRTFLKLSSVSLCSVAVIACSPSSPTPEPDGGTSSSSTGGFTCALKDSGDPTKDIELELTVRGIDDNSTLLKDGDTVPLITPPQGGRVVFIGVRARNLSPCGVVLSGVVGDPSSKKIMLDERTVNLRTGADGWATSIDSNIASFANVAVCPNEWSDADLFDSPYDLSLTLTDKKGRTATKKVSATPKCAETDPTLDKECHCICKHGYVLGQTCP